MRIVGDGILPGLARVTGTAVGRVAARNPAETDDPRPDREPDANRDALGPIPAYRPVAGGIAVTRAVTVGNPIEATASATFVVRFTWRSNGNRRWPVARDRHAHVGGLASEGGLGATFVPGPAVPHRVALRRA